MQKIQNKMITHLVKVNGSKKCNGRTHNEKKKFKRFLNFYLYIYMLVVEKKVTKKILPHLYQKIYISIYKRKKPKNAHQRSEEKPHGIKEIFDQ
jgi:hypothetical protein